MSLARADDSLAPRLAVTTPDDVERWTVVVFVRAPEPGRVKTRIATTLGADRALEIYRELGSMVLRDIAPFMRALEAEPPVREIVIAHTPDDAADAVRAWLGPAWPSVPQGDGDLGARMARAVSGRFAAGATRVVVIGTDCPELDTGVLDAAFDHLAEHDVVLGPAMDGGYYLVGVHHRAAPVALAALFEDVPWSSADTLRVTLARAAARRLRVALLEQRRDIDTAEDWALWRSGGAT